MLGLFTPPRRFSRAPPAALLLMPEALKLAPPGSCVAPLLPRVVATGDTASRLAGENAESPETAPTPVERLGIIDEEVRAGACARYQAEACARCNSLESSMS